MKYLLLVILFLYMKNIATTPALPCSDVRGSFVMQKLGPGYYVPELARKNQNLLVCSKSKLSCCSLKMEKLYGKSAKKNLSVVVDNAFNVVKFRLKNFLRRFDVIFQLHKEEAKSRLDDVVSRSVSSHLRRGIESFSSFFKVIKPYRNKKKFIQQKQHARELVNRFLSELFTLKFEEQTYLDLRFEERNCIRKQSAMFLRSRKLPQKTTKHLIKLINETSLFVQALSSAVESLNVNSNFFINQECQNALIKMRYCSHCSMLIEARPCLGYCRNVISGCLIGVTEIDKYWQFYVSSVKKLTNRMLQRGNGVQSFFDYLTNQVKNILQRPILAHEVKSIKETCFIPQRKKRSPNLIVTSLTEKKKQSELSEKIEEKMNENNEADGLKSFLIKFNCFLNGAKNSLAILPKRICDSDSFSAPASAQQNCWNGNSIIKRYAYPITKQSFEGQQQNPEMQIKEVHPVVQKSVEKLRISTKMLKLGVDDPIPLALLVSPSYVVNQTTPFPELDPSLCNGRDKCWDPVSGSNRNLNQFVTGQKLDGHIEGTFSVTTPSKTNKEVHKFSSANQQATNTVDLFKKTRTFLIEATTNPENSAPSLLFTRSSYLKFMLQISIFIYFFLM